MGKHRAPYPAEFRAHIVELVKAGRTPEELAREFEPSVQTIINWVAQADIDAGVRQEGLTTAERQELTRLRRENRQLTFSLTPRPGSPARQEPCPRRIRIHESKPGPLAHCYDGAAAGSLDQRLLRVAGAGAIKAVT